MKELTPNLLPEGQSCGTCRFAGTSVLTPTGSARMLVRCLRFPPQRLGQGITYNADRQMEGAWEDTGWPVLTWDDWCGEWQTRRR